jgi:hypothetical protein
LLENGQQGLFRTSLGYWLKPQAQLRLGFAWAETYPYGIPINSYGKRFTEYRIFQMVSLFDSIGKTHLQHRFMLEQRWLGKYTSPNFSQEDSYSYVNRVRYLFRAQIPIYKKMYLAIYDEVFIGFGDNIGDNIFDQNRAGCLVGFTVWQNGRMELGYLNQILQLSRTVDGKNVFQHNNGITLSIIANLDLTARL